jgi:hypothetical protein
VKVSACEKEDEVVKYPYCNVSLSVGIFQETLAACTTRLSPVHIINERSTKTQMGKLLALYMCRSENFRPVVSRTGQPTYVQLGLRIKYSVFT